MPLDVPCICDGPVETWLGSVVDSMRTALWAEFKTSLPKYDELPRTTWMFQQSAQNTITVSRMIFTQEINEAFEQLEEGNDNAIKDMWQKQARGDGGTCTSSTCIASTSSTPSVVCHECVHFTRCTPLYDPSHQMTTWMMMQMMTYP